MKLHHRALKLTPLLTCAGLLAASVSLTALAAPGGSVGAVYTVSNAAEGNQVLVYALNAGSDSLAGFRLGPDGKLSPLTGSYRPLSGVGTAPAQAEFNSHGDLLVVTEKATGNLLAYPVDDHGLLGAPSVNASPTPTPFGFAFGKRNQVFVSEAAGGAPGASAVSSWQLDADASATLVSASAPTEMASACWLVVTNDGRFAYTANTGASSLSAFRIGTDGALTLLDANGIATAVPPGSAPADMALSRNSRYLYVLARGAGTITAFRVAGDGSLHEVQRFSAGRIRMASRPQAAATWAWQTSGDPRSSICRRASRR